MFKIGIFVARKGGKEKLVKWLPERFNSEWEADAAVTRKNRELGVINNKPMPGRRFAMYDSA